MALDLRLLDSRLSADRRGRTEPGSIGQGLESRLHDGPLAIRSTRRSDDVKESVLIIENDPDAVELLSLLFDREGFTVYTAGDGAQGVALARAHIPDAPRGR